MHFIDEVKIYLKSGDGGPGCLSFRREKNIPYGGPNGGNGGRGGDIEFCTISGLNTLIDFRYKQHFKAKSGEHGKGKNRDGASRSPLIINIPIGTQIISDDGELICDMNAENQSKILLKGGDGGFGNAHYKSSTNQAPTKSTEGWPGEEMWVWLKLKLISDAGLVGLPNAGKSTFLARTTSAKPKIADYPFTTLKPQLGVVYIDDEEFVLADIPGLIENAHLGVGLGDKFLKHIERCRVLLHLIDINSDDIYRDYQIIKKELIEYGIDLEDKYEIVALSKADSISIKEANKKKTELEKKLKNTVSIISSSNGLGMTEILRKLKKNIDKHKDD